MHPLFTSAAATRWRAAHAQQLTRRAQLAKLHALATRAESWTLSSMIAMLIVAAIAR